MISIASNVAATLDFYHEDSITVASEYSLALELKRIYHNQIALGAAIMELTLLADDQGAAEAGGNLRSAREASGENAASSHKVWLASINQSMVNRVSAQSPLSVRTLPRRSMMNV